MIDNRNLFTCAEISASDLSSVESKLGGKAHYFQDHSGKKKNHDFCLGKQFIWYFVCLENVENIFFTEQCRSILFLLNTNVR